MQVLTPTIRVKSSEIWLTDNPTDPLAPVEGYTAELRPDTRSTHMTWRDCPWFPQELEAERAYLQTVDVDAHDHIWEGHCLTHSDAQVFKGKYFVEQFEPKTMTPELLVVLDAAARFEDKHRRGLQSLSTQVWNGPYLGADFGFSVDPSTLVRAWVCGTTLYIDREAWGVGVDTNNLPALYDQVPDSRKHVIRADSSRPETISALKQNGFPKMTAAKKGKGSVEDGIGFLRSFARIVIHPRCVKTIDEFRLFSYKVDRLSGDPLPDLKPGNDHIVDALRYALEPLIRRRSSRIAPLRA
jgi:phage terminase large subunit